MSTSMAGLSRASATVTITCVACCVQPDNSDIASSRHVELSVEFLISFDYTVLNTIIAARDSRSNCVISSNKQVVRVFCIYVVDLYACIQCMSMRMNELTKQNEIEIVPDELEYLFEVIPPDRQENAEKLIARVQCRLQRSVNNVSGER